MVVAALTLYGSVATAQEDVPIEVPPTVPEVPQMPPDGCPAGTQANDTTASASGDYVCVCPGSEVIGVLYGDGRFVADPDVWSEDGTCATVWPVVVEEPEVAGVTVTPAVETEVVQTGPGRAGAVLPRTG